MEIQHSTTEKYILFIVVATLLTITGFIAISIPAYEQIKLVEASPTIGAILLMFTGILLIIYGCLEIRKIEKESV
jgi:uncharacterized membrane protein SirB2